MGFEIVTDSSANLPDSIVEKNNIEILSLVYRFGDTEYPSYIKGAKNDLTEFYARLRNKEVAVTACMSPGTCREMFEKMLEEGKDILYIGFSSALSAAYPTARNVIEELKTEYPDRKLFAVDTLAASLGEGLLVTHALKLREEGKTIEEINEWLLENRLNLCHWFTVDDLMYLNRGGRVSTSAAVLGTVLNVKPVMHVDNEGRLVPVSKARGRKRSLQVLVDEMEKTAIDPQKQIVYISHADCEEDANYLADLIKERLGVKEFLIHQIEPVIGSHCGPGTVALFFFGNQR